MGSRPLFRVFGIPVTIDLWFLVGLVLFYSLNGGGRLGFYTAIAVGVFVLIHELGHALTAKAFGAEPEIHLNFMIGWATYANTKQLSRAKQNIISLMGPVTEFVVAMITLWCVRRWIHHDVQADIQQAVIWGGMVLAGLNLLPLWPLDGGHIVDSLLEKWFGHAARRAFMIFTLIASAGVLAYALASPSNQAGTSSLDHWVAERLFDGLTLPLPQASLKILIAVPALFVTSAYFIAIFTALGSFGFLQAGRRGLNPRGTMPVARPPVDEQTLSAVRSAERQGWSFGVPGEYPQGWVASPWLQAHLALTSGAPAEDVSQQLLGLGAPNQNWLVDRYDRPEIGRLLDFVPPMVANTPMVVAARVFSGSPEQLISAALAAYHGSPTAEGFYVIAEGLAVRNQPDEAMSWLTRAVDEHPDPRRVALSRPLSALHGRSDFQQLLGVAERAAAPPQRR